jgi:hypothetical protein
VISAITPFNHPMNQVAHKVAPSIATNNRMVLKPSEKTPMSAYYLAELLYEAGLPREMFQVITGDPREIADELITNENVDSVTFTGGVAVGKYIASKAGYRRIVWSWEGTTRSSSWKMPTSTRRPRSPRRAPTRTAASAARREAHAGARGGGRPLRRAAGGEDARLDLRRPDGSEGRDGPRSSTSRGEALRGAR